LSGPAEERDGRTWEEVFDLAVLVAAFIAGTGRILGLITTSQFLFFLAAALGAACAAYLVSRLREDEDRPIAAIPLAVVAALVLVETIALGGGPRWLQIVVILGFLLWFAIDHGERNEGAPRDVDDRPHPYL
jgi:hypothetical protein